MHVFRLAEMQWQMGLALRESPCMGVAGRELQRTSGCKGAYHHSVNVMKLIQKLRSALQRLPMLADSTLGVRVDASSLVSLRWCVLRMVAAQHPDMLYRLSARCG